jgi:hypothetical protein
MIFVTYWYVMFATLAVVVFWTLRWPRARLGFPALAHSLSSWFRDIEKSEHASSLNNSCTVAASSSKH